MFYRLTVYSSTNGLAVVGVFIQFQDFPSCFGVNDGIKTVGMQRNECVSMSGLHKSQDRTSISVIAAEIF
jgi:hypothetical protein